MTSTTVPTFIAPSPLTVAKRAEARNAGIVYSTSSPATPGEAPVVVEAPRPTVSAEVKADARANQRVTRAIRKTRVAKQPFSRLTAPEFDPALVTRNPGR